MKEYNIKRHYCTKHAAKYDGIEGQLRFDKIEQESFVESPRQKNTPTH